MFRWLRSGLAVILILLWIAPAQASAYSYGDANTEDVAETFKLIEASLSGASPDWKAAEAAHKARRSEIKSHFGDSVAVTLDKNIEAKDSKLLIANYKAVLVMNLDRRFTYAIKDVNDYAGAKLLLAKAKATYDTMSPYVGSGTDEIDAAFEAALDALGNPGLFGVGKKEADPQLFKEKINFIYAKVKPLFPYKAYVKPAEPKPEPKPEPKLDPQPSAEPSPDKETVASPQPSPAEKPSAEPTDEASASPMPSASAAPSEQASASSEATASETATSVTEAAESPAAAQPEPSESASTSDSGEQMQEAAAGAEGHAPMERSDKTNTWITVLVIGGVILVGGGALWFIRKKGLI